MKKGEDANAGVSAGSDKPVFLQAPFIRQFEDKIIFECKLSANPVPSFSWYFGGSQLNNPAKYKPRLVSEGRTHTIILEINNLVGRDSGDYKVVARNTHGEAESNIKLNIESRKNSRLPEGTAPHFLSKPITTQTQDSLLIQLELEANPVPSVSWYLDNKDLNEAGSRFHTKIEKKSADKYLLSLELSVRIIQY